MNLDDDGKFHWWGALLGGILVWLLGIDLTREDPPVSHPDTRTTDDDVAREFSRLIGILRDPEQRQDRDTFPRNLDAARQPGLYSWWADDSARSLIGSVLGVEVPSLIYVGQTGGGGSSGTLFERILNKHFRGHSSSSTLRETLSALLRKPLRLDLLAPGELTAESNARLSCWMRDHLQVAIAPCGHRDLLERIERVAIRSIDPPLNLLHVERTKSRQILTKLRGEFRQAGAD